MSEDSQPTKKRKWVTSWRMFPWVPDGVYDFQAFAVRYVIVDGMPETIISKIWLDVGGPDNVSSSLRQAWGAFPDFPPKPVKN